MPSSPLRRLAPRTLLGFLAGMVMACQDAEVTAPPAVELTPAAVVLLDSLYLDEFRAAERYGNVMGLFGVVEPFHGLLPEQAQRIEALHGIYATRPTLVVPDPYARLHPFEYYRDLAGACELSAMFEQRTVERYERLLRMRLPTDVTVAARANRDAAARVGLTRTRACR